MSDTGQVLADIAAEIGCKPDNEEILVAIARLRAERDDLIEQCAVAAEQQDRIGYEWVKDSLWANILKRAGQNVRDLKSA